MGKKIDDYTKLPNFERKQFPLFVKTFDDDQGVVEHFVAIMGNRDGGGDRIPPGAFSKTIVEHGPRVKVLDQHNMDSVTRIIGKPLALREVGKKELTPEVLEYAPDATGGLLATTQYAIDTTRGRDVFNLVKGGYAPEFSIGYDAVDVEFIKEKAPDGEGEITTRLLKTIRLWEYSNVVFGMNPATAVLSAKAAPAEGKPWRAVHEGDMWRVYKLDEDGEPTGEPLGEFDTEDEANQQVRALYANEDGDKGKSRKVNLSEIVSRVQSAFQTQFNPANGPYRYWCQTVHDDHIVASYESEDGPQDYWIGYAIDAEGNITFAPRAEWREGDYDFIPKAGRKAGRVLARRNAERIMSAMSLLHEALADAGLMDMHEDEEDPDAPKARSDNQPEQPAGPVTPPTENLLTLIEIYQSQLEVLP